MILYDLPPMLQSDDVMAFLPHLDCVLLIAAAERSRLDEVDKCEQELSEQTQVLGVVPQQVPLRRRGIRLLLSMAARPRVQPQGPAAATIPAARRFQAAPRGLARSGARNAAS